MSRTRAALLWATLGFYVAIVAAVLTTSWLVRLDWQVMLFRPYKQWPELHAFLDYFVVLGQRGPTAALVAAWLGWRSWRQRTLRPLLVMACSLLLLNVTVGAAKLGMGREGPHYATVMGSNEMFLTGDIFPSGHTANAVVTWGILAYLATTPRARRSLSVIAAFCALGVGATTVYLGTHWVSDVLLGWAAGLLILLALPWCEPLINRVDTLLLAVRDRVFGVAGAFGSGLPPRRLEPTPLPVPAAVVVSGDEPLTHGDPVPGVAARAGTAPRPAKFRPRIPSRAHPGGRPDHPPARALGSR
ncbi:phosphatase PAP2 family protein [Streptomyces mayteni]